MHAQINASSQSGSNNFYPTFGDIYEHHFLKFKNFVFLPHPINYTEDLPVYFLQQKRFKQVTILTA